jgi:hypothetical protein
MYHCHQEATEHMQMGMLGNLYVEPKQNGTKVGGYKYFAYNDGDGSTGYDTDGPDADHGKPLEFPIQIGSFDPNFHDQHVSIQPLPFALMRDKYPMLNGRGYPDTVNPDPILTDTVAYGVKPSQPVTSLVSVPQGKKALLRLSNLAVTRFYTLASQVPLHVVGHSAKQLVGPTGKKLYYDTTSVTLGGGESIDVILDTANVPKGTYMLYTTNLNYLSNNDEAQSGFGGMATEIHVN